MRQLTRCVLATTAATAIAAAVPEPAATEELDCTSLFSRTTQVVAFAGVKTTSSKTLVDLPGATFTFLPGARCLVVEVTGQVRTVAPNVMRLRVTVTGDLEEPPFPSSRDVYATTTTYDGRSATFFVSLFEGQKTAKVQFMSVNGSPVSLANGVIIFHYSPGS